MILNPIDIFISPDQFFVKSISKNWKVAILSCLTILLVFNFIIVTFILLPEREHISLENADNTEEQIEAIHHQYYSLSTITISIVWFLIMDVIKYLFISLFLWVIIRFICNIKYIEVLTVVLFSSFIYIIKYLIITPMMIINETSKIETSFVLFLSNISEHSILYRFLSSFDIFTIWFIFIVATGFNKTFKIAFKKSLLIIMTMWLLWILIYATLGDIIKFS